MSIISIQSFAGAMFGKQIGTVTVTAVNAEVAANGLEATYNKYFSLAFGALTSTQVGELLVANLGIPEAGKEEAVAYVVGKLGAADASTHGQVISSILSDFAGLSSHAVFGAAASAWNNKVATAVAYTGADDLAVGTVVGGSFTLTTVAAGDLFSGTAGNDVITGTNTTFQAADVIVDSSTSDNDTLNLTVTAAVAGNAVVANIENINFINNAFATLPFDATTITGAKTITLSNIKAGGTTAATVNNVPSNVAVKAGSGVSGVLTVDLAGGANTVDAGAATTVTLTDANHLGVSITATKATAINLDGAGHTDTITGAADDAASVSAAGAVALDTDTNDQVEFVTLSGNGAAVTYTIAAEGAGAGANAYTITGNQNVTVSIAADDLSNTTVTNTATGVTTIAANAAGTGAVDFSKIATTAVIRLDANVTHATTVASGAQLVAKVSQGAGITAASATRTTNTVTVEANDGVATKSTITLAGNFTNIDTVNLVATDNLTANGLSFGATATVNVSGAGDVVLGLLTAKEVKAGTATGTITATASTNAKSITTGSGNDTVTVLATETLTLAGGDGTDTLSIDGALNFVTANKTLTLSGFEVLQLDVGDSGAETVTLDSKAFNGRSWSVVGGTTADDTLAIVMSESTLNLTDVSIDATSIVQITTTADSTRVNSALTITGQAGNDHITGGNAGDTIATGNGTNTVNAGTGDDTVTGGTGVDTIDGQDGNDTIYGGAGADILSGSAGSDLIYGGADGDTIDGGADDDTLYGEAGADTIVGGTGNDTIDGGTGADTIVGAGAWSTTGTSEVQSLTIGSAPNANGNLAIAGVNVAVMATDTPAQIAGKIAAASVDIRAGAGNENILTIAQVGATNVVAITYATTAGDVVLATATGGAGFIGTVAETTKGTTIGTLTAGGVATGDVLTGGSEKDLFVFGDSDTSLALMPTITDLNLGTSTVAGQVDRIGIESNTDTVAVVTATTAQQAAINAETTLSLAVVNALTNVAAAQGNAAIITYGDNKYFLYNGDNNATFDAAADYVIKVTGVTGTLDATDIVVIG